MCNCLIISKLSIIGSTLIGRGVIEKGTTTSAFFSMNNLIYLLSLFISKLTVQSI